MRNDWLNRTTKQLILNTSPATMGVLEPASNAEWIYDPDMSAVEGYPVKYWIITGDVVTLMDAGERATIDAAMLEAARDQVATQLDQQENIIRAFMLIVLDEVNLLRTQHGLSERTVQQLRNAIRDKLGS